MPSERSLFAGLGPSTPEHPAPTHLLLHFSDAHFTGDDGRLYGDVDSRSRLVELLDGVVASGLHPDALLFTGDLADRGESAAYERLRQVVDPVAEQLGCPVIWLMGNHDDRENLRRSLLGERPTTEPLDRVYDLGGLRVIALDSSVPGHHHGEVSVSQLEWLSAQLTTPAPAGTVIAVHHPPLPVIQQLAVLTELRGQHALAEVIAGSDVRLVLAGHQHYPSTGMFAGVPVSVAAASCYTQDLTVDQGGTRGMDGAQSFNLVYLYPDTIVSSVSPIGSYATVGEYVSPAAARERLESVGYASMADAVAASPLVAG